MGDLAKGPPRICWTQTLCFGQDSNFVGRDYCDVNELAGLPVVAVAFCEQRERGKISCMTWVRVCSVFKLMLGLQGGIRRRNYETSTNKTLKYVDFKL